MQPVLLQTCQGSRNPTSTASTPTRKVCSLNTQRPRINRPHAVVFLERLQSYPALPTAHVETLGKLYHLSTTPNAEIRSRFYELALLDASSHAAKEFTPGALAWVVGEDGTGIIKGRMKFCRPIFRAANKVDKEMALSSYLRNKTAFHPIAQKLIEKVSAIAS